MSSMMAYAQCVFCLQRMALLLLLVALVSLFVNSSTLVILPSSLFGLCVNIKKSIPSSCLVCWLYSSLWKSCWSYWIVGEKDEVSIKDVADAIVKALDFKGDYSVCSSGRSAWKSLITDMSFSSSILHVPMANTRRLLAMKSSWSTFLTLNLLPLNKVSVKIKCARVRGSDQ